MQGTMPGRRPRVIVLGAGFGGLAAAKALGRDRGRVDVLVIDRENHHLFQPLLYEVAMAALSAPDVSAPVRSVLAPYANTLVVLAEAREIDLERRCVIAAEGDTMSYDYLVLATGMEPNYFGHDEWAAAAPSPKGLDCALEIRKRVLLAFEEAERTNDPLVRRRLLEFAVVGGGPTGVEFAGALAELSRATLARDFRRIDPRQTRVHLVEAGPRLLPAYPEELSKSAERQLESLGVLVRTSAPVVNIDSSGVTLQDGSHIDAATIIWGAGVKPSSLALSLPVEHDRQGRILVAPDLSLPGRPEVFVIGDIAHVEQDGEVLPGLAPVAMQEGRAVARSIERSVRGLPRVPFRYVDKGMLATIGRSRAVGVIRGLKLTGWLAWITWVVVHIFYLIGFRNRLVVAINWVWSYVTYKRGARVIAGVHGVCGSAAPSRPLTSGRAVA